MCEICEKLALWTFIWLIRIVYLLNNILKGYALTVIMEGNILFNDGLNTFYLQLYGVGHMVKDHSDNERGNPLQPHGLLFPISSKGSFICTIPHPLLHQLWSIGWNEKCYDGTDLFGLKCLRKNSSDWQEDQIQTTFCPTGLVCGCSLKIWVVKN